MLIISQSTVNNKKISRSSNSNFHSSVENEKMNFNIAKSALTLGWRTVRNKTGKTKTERKLKSSLILKMISESAAMLKSEE